MKNILPQCILQQAQKHQIRQKIFENDDWTLAPGGSKDHSLLLELKTLENVTGRSTADTETEPVTIEFQVEVAAEQID